MFYQIERALHTIANAIGNRCILKHQVTSMVNPFNRALTSGGSSGGEGPLIGLRGSCLGVGSDVGTV